MSISTAKFAVRRGDTTYSCAGADLQNELQVDDNLIVNRNGIDYSYTIDDILNDIKDDDFLVVTDVDSVTYKVRGEKFLELFYSQPLPLKNPVIDGINVVGQTVNLIFDGEITEGETPYKVDDIHWYREKDGESEEINLVEGGTGGYFTEIFNAQYPFIGFGQIGTYDNLAHFYSHIEGTNLYQYFFKNKSTSPNSSAGKQYTLTNAYVNPDGTVTAATQKNIDNELPVNQYVLWGSKSIEIMAPVRRSGKNYVAVLNEDGSFTEHDEYKGIFCDYSVIGGVSLKYRNIVDSSGKQLSPLSKDIYESSCYDSAGNKSYKIESKRQLSNGMYREYYEISVADTVPGEMVPDGPYSPLLLVEKVLQNEVRSDVCLTKYLPDDGKILFIYSQFIIIYDTQTNIAREIDGFSVQCVYLTLNGNEPKFKWGKSLGGAYEITYLVDLWSPAGVTEFAQGIKQVYLEDDTLKSPFFTYKIGDQYAYLRVPAEFYDDAPYGLPSDFRHKLPTFAEFANLGQRNIIMGSVSTTYGSYGVSSFFTEFFDSEGSTRESYVLEPSEESHNVYATVVHSDNKDFQVVLKSNTIEDIQPKPLDLIKLLKVKEDVKIDYDYSTHSITITPAVFNTDETERPILENNYSVNDNYWQSAVATWDTRNRFELLTHEEIVELDVLKSLPPSHTNTEFGNSTNLYAFFTSDDDSLYTLKFLNSGNIQINAQAFHGTGMGSFRFVNERNIAISALDPGGYVTIIGFAKANGIEPKRKISTETTSIDLGNTVPNSSYDFNINVYSDSIEVTHTARDSVNRVSSYATIEIDPRRVFEELGLPGYALTPKGWFSAQAAEENFWKSVTYGDGKFVAVSSTGTNQVMHSDDGINWTSAATPGNTNWTSVTYGDGNFVAVAVNKIMYATDPAGPWTSITAPADKEWSSITYGDGKFVAVATGPYTNFGSQRVIMYATDPAGTWTAVATPLNESWNSVTYGNGKFVAVSATGNGVLYAEDPAGPWTEVVAADGRWKSVTYGDGKFVAVSNARSKRVMYATDPAGPWTGVEILDQNEWLSITYADGKFVAVGRGSINPAEDYRIMYATDPAGPWTAATAPEDNNWSSITYGDDKFVAISHDGNNRVMYSFTGTDN